MAKRPVDPNIFAKNIVDGLIAKYDPEAAPTEPIEAPKSGKNPAAVALGKLGGSKGGHARARSLSSKRRSQIAKKAARARWGKGR